VKPDLRLAGGRETASACEIFGVSRRNAFLWKWRYWSADGREQVCPQEYKRFLECAAAARESGYAPRSDWTGPCARVFAPPGPSKP
jgi:hypothetical protein